MNGGRSPLPRSAAARRWHLLAVALTMAAGLSAMAWLMLGGFPSWWGGRGHTAGVVVLLLDAAVMAVLVQHLIADLRGHRSSRH